MYRPGLLLTSGTLLALLAAPLIAAGSAPPAPAPGAAPRPADPDLAFFESRVWPLLAQHCFACHSGKNAQGGLRLDTAESFRRGGGSGPLVVPDNPEQSRLLQAVRYNDASLQMPPSGKLPERDIAVLAEWVQRGAPWPAPKTREAAKPKGEADPRDPTQPTKHWAFQPLRVSPLPRLKNPAWVRNPIDAFVLAGLEAKGLSPSPRADARTLIRRVYFDLTGLPPAPAEVEAFVRECREETKNGGVEEWKKGSISTKGASTPPPFHPSIPSPAYERLVDRLLASPQYGERWGRHWLDLVRYCDVPESWAQSDAQPWLYRDWVVDALNRDLPYNQFLKLQLAADEMPDAAPKDAAALGFLGLSPTYWKELKLAPDVIKTVVAEEWEERIGMVSGTVLGLTVACARCHDHKFDPISQQDYYALAGIFASTRQVNRPLVPPDQGPVIMQARAEVKQLEAQAAQFQQAAAKDAAHAAEMKQKAAAAQARAAQIRKETPGFDAPLAYAVESASLDVLPDGPDRTRLEYREGVGQDVPMQLRGNPARTGPVVPRRFLTVLSRGSQERFTHGSGRADLADAIFKNATPLTARVMVNRVWKHHFGRGLVETPSNFGLQGDKPTHPELLDWLAARFAGAVPGPGSRVPSRTSPDPGPGTRDSGLPQPWSLKSLHRLILLSNTYQQSSHPIPNPQSLPPVRGARIRNSQSVDPENRLLGRTVPRRLEVEAWRDAVLSASGKLDLRMGGAAQELSDPKNVRRTLYGVIRRRDLDDLLRLYDFPDPTGHVPARFHTTTPAQQLYVLNSPFIAAQAVALAARLRSEVPADTRGQVRRAYELLYGRAATAKELEAAVSFLGDQPADERWNQLAEVLLARNELMFVD